MDGAVTGCGQCAGAAVVTSTNRRGTRPVRADVLRTGRVTTPNGVVGGAGIPEDQSGRMFSACGPFWPWVTSNSTRWFSSSER